ncbi:universal stress protein [Adhaeribacter rhizoryzae]|uniref:Universal stress protein n=1 Tax=Adhaeribacter rhizoryzae TaxID=2607907 RepID=A0A5M6DPR8_9BACT|nr:universal stress protein [Adhaeribacter rhizoryzae]KAA5548209.1 universal stress protein [Adhaeribacter rhizoryzae]
MKTFLVPTDFSENATNALNYAVSLASQVNGKIIIVHVVNFIVIPVRSGKLVSLTEDTDLQYYEALNEFAAVIRKKNIACEVAVIDQYAYGSFQESLNQFIPDQQVDLVIMGTKGATNFLNKVVGTNTSEFIKVAVCPVLIIPGGAQYSNIKHLAYATDFNRDNTIFLQQLFKFTQSFPSQVYILDAKPDTHLNKEVWDQSLPFNANEFPKANYTLVQLNEADVITNIQAFVHINQIDLLAIPVPNQGFFEDIFKSSISKELVYQPTLPLLALPENI